MTNTYLIQTLIELSLAVFFIWGLFNETKLAKLERKLFKKFCKKEKAVEQSFNKAA